MKLFPIAAVCCLLCCISYGSPWDYIYYPDVGRIMTLQYVGLNPNSRFNDCFGGTNYDAYIWVDINGGALMCVRYPDSRSLIAWVYCETGYDQANIRRNNGGSLLRDWTYSTWPPSLYPGCVVTSPPTLYPSVSNIVVAADTNGSWQLVIREGNSSVVLAITNGTLNSDSIVAAINALRGGDDADGMVARTVGEVYDPLVLDDDGNVVSGGDLSSGSVTHESRPNAEYHSIEETSRNIKKMLGMNSDIRTFGKSTMLSAIYLKQKASAARQADDAEYAKNDTSRRLFADLSTAFHDHLSPDIVTIRDRISSVDDRAYEIRDNTAAIADINRYGFADVISAISSLNMSPTIDVNVEPVSSVDAIVNWNDYPGVQASDYDARDDYWLTVWDQFTSDLESWLGSKDDSYLKRIDEVLRPGGGSSVFDTSVNSVFANNGLAWLDDGSGGSAVRDLNEISVFKDSDNNSVFKNTEGTSIFTDILHGMSDANIQPQSTEQPTLDWADTAYDGPVSQLRDITNSLPVDLAVTLSNAYNHVSAPVSKVRMPLTPGEPSKAAQKNASYDFFGFFTFDGLFPNFQVLDVMPLVVGPYDFSVDLTGGIRMFRLIVSWFLLLAFALMIIRKSVSMGVL